jgi:hypothetical protein
MESTIGDVHEKFQGALVGTSYLGQGSTDCSTNVTNIDATNFQFASTLAADRTGASRSTFNSDVTQTGILMGKQIFGSDQSSLTTDCSANLDGTLGASTKFTRNTADTKLTFTSSSAVPPTFAYPFIAKDVSTATSPQMYSNVASRMMQKEALHFSQGAFWGSIVIVQWADLVICKTRWLSLGNQGMSNGTMNFGLFFETMLAAVLAYTPAVANALGTRPIRLTHWFPAMPFSIFIISYDETRKFLMRTTSEVYVNEKTGRAVRNPGWLEYNTYY